MEAKTNFFNETIACHVVWWTTADTEYLLSQTGTTAHKPVRKTLECCKSADQWSEPTTGWWSVQAQRNRA